MSRVIRCDRQRRESAHQAKADILAERRAEQKAVRRSLPWHRINRCARNAAIGVPDELASRISLAQATQLFHHRSGSKLFIKIRDF